MAQVLVLLGIVVGAVGLFFALPGGRRDLSRAGLLVLIAAGGALLYFAARAATGDTPLAGFITLALVALVAAVRVITHVRPVYSALWFVLLAATVAGLLVNMQAEFLAAALLVVYAGAILVTYIFVIMLAQQARTAVYDARAREPLLGSLAGFVLLSALAGQFGYLMQSPDRSVGLGGPTLQDGAGTLEAVGTPLMTQYIVGVELIGLLLTVALIGAIAIARRKPARPRNEDFMVSADLGAGSTAAQAYSGEGQH